MTQKIIISIDCMGGDNAPEANIKGISIFLSSTSEVSFFLYGDENRLLPIIKKYPNLKGRYEIFHTDEFIKPCEKPSVALKKGKNSSMRLAIDSVKAQKSNAIVSSGNTGALMAIAKIVLRSLPAVDRPAIVTYIPNQKNNGTILLDMGANVNCSSEILYQFAVMGHSFAKVVLNKQNPTIGVLNIGSEDMKGIDSVRDAAELIRGSHLSDSFHGYVEGDDITKGTVDVVVADGFLGNIVLKSIEGTAKLFLSIVKESFARSIFSKIGYLFAKKSLKKSLLAIEPKKYNGAMLIGLNGVVVKSHGSADGEAFANAINVAHSLVKNGVNKKIMDQMEIASFFEN
ncbi:phosphate acyltransferase PlsX [Flavobacteriaceae bacterium]|nr:phosphate acyltransferase PlsX [Flavobacteriaceae bacterium]